jgi:hypothetical protein
MAGDSLRIGETKKHLDRHSPHPSSMRPRSALSKPSPPGGREDAASLDRPARGGCEISRHD